jgi:hypothetical protein
LGGVDRGGRHDNGRSLYTRSLSLRQGSRLVDKAQVQLQVPAASAPARYLGGDCINAVVTKAEIVVASIASMSRMKHN